MNIAVDLPMKICPEQLVLFYNFSINWLTFMLQIFEVAPTFFMVDIQNAAGDAGEYLKVNYSKLFS